MSESFVSLKVAADRTSYMRGDNVLITVAAQKKNRAAAQEPVKLYVFAPDGKKVYQAKLSTDNLGKAMGMYRVGKNTAGGRYSIEAHSSAASVAFASFLILDRKFFYRKFQLFGQQTRPGML
ncbi:MAG TPA: hypothetical protein GX699_10315 [Firmicutes bacterium]|nr:hypothetical protein [Bacillota bacterium]